MTPNSKMVHYGLLLVALVNYVRAECPNACSGHGDCGNFDMCNCWRNWMANDCSERICPFGLAQVDTPLGDLDMSNSVDFASWGGSTWTGGDKVQYHPMYYTTGTSEKFPYMNFVNAGNDYIFDDSAHYYSECSNKGICDRASGICECFEAYEGSACQRASCPNQCSGHGTCESISELSTKDNDNIYDLWDKDITYGCDCDPGYYGADCSLRYCKYGVDPLYYDDEATIRVNTWNLEIDASGTTAGTFAVKFYDVFDEDYLTTPIKFDDTDTSVGNELKDALKALPNTVVEDLIYNADIAAGDDEQLWRLTFKTNPGKARTPEIDVYLNGNHGANSKTLESVATQVWPGAISGEFRDYFYSRCEGVSVTVTDTTSLSVGFIGQTAKITNLDDTAADGGSEEDKLKKCLGDSNGESSDNVGIYDWDTGANSFSVWNAGASPAAAATGYGVGQYPHAIKLVDTTASTEYVGGAFYLTYWHADVNLDGTEDDGAFMLLSRLWKGDGATSGSTQFYVYTTDVVVKMVYVTSAAYNYVYNSANNDGYTQIGDVDGGGAFTAGDKNDELPVYAYWNTFDTTIYTSYDTSCEYMNSYADDTSGTYGDSTAAHKRYVYPCLSKGDYIMLTDGGWGDYNDGSADTAYEDASAATGANKQNAHMDALAPISPTAPASPAVTIAGVGNTMDYSGHLYEIVKIWTAPYTSTTATTENRYRITVDKPIPWDGSNKCAAAVQTSATFTTSTAHGITPIFKFDTETQTMDGNKPTYYEYVSECSNKGLCNAQTALCECFKGYTNADCGTQSAFAL